MTPKLLEATASVTESWVAGVDGAPGGWAAVFMDKACRSRRVRKVSELANVFDAPEAPSIVAVDIPIGLLDAYREGGGACDREVRRLLEQRGSSVFSAPIRPALSAVTWREADGIMRSSALNAKGMSQQAFGIWPKVREVDALLQQEPSCAAGT